MISTSLLSQLQWLMMRPIHMFNADSVRTISSSRNQRQWQTASSVIRGHGVEMTSVVLQPTRLLSSISDRRASRLHETML